MNVESKPVDATVGAPGGVLPIHREYGKPCGSLGPHYPYSLAGNIPFGARIYIAQFAVLRWLQDEASKLQQRLHINHGDFICAASAASRLMSSQ